MKTRTTRFMIASALLGFAATGPACDGCTSEEPSSESSESTVAAATPADEPNSVPCREPSYQDDELGFCVELPFELSTWEVLREVEGDAVLVELEYPKPSDQDDQDGDEARYLRIALNAEPFPFDETREVLELAAEAGVRRDLPAGGRFYQYRGCADEGFNCVDLTESIMPHPRGVIGCQLAEHSSDAPTQAAAIKICETLRLTR